MCVYMYLSLFCGIMDWSPSQVVPVQCRATVVQNPFQSLHLYGDVREETKPLKVLIIKNITCPLAAAK